jgi:hypothetical protein
MSLTKEKMFAKGVIIKEIIFKIFFGQGRKYLPIGRRSLM